MKVYTRSAMNAQWVDVSVEGDDIEFIKKFVGYKLLDGYDVKIVHNDVLEDK